MIKKALYIATGLAALLLIYFYFIPAFAGRIDVSEYLVLGPFKLRLYGLILAAAILVGYLIARNNSWRVGISKSEIDDIAFWLVICGIVGARLYYVIFDFDYFAGNPVEIYKIWHGGLSIYGAILSGLIFIVAYSFNKAYSAYQLLDLVAVSLPLPQAIGRLGNFFNQEAFGSPTNLPWKMHVQIGKRPAIFSDSQFFHPTFLYEALGSVLIFFILRKIFGKVPAGTAALIYLILYSLVRFVVEPLRLDSVFVGNFRADQLVAFALIILCGATLLVRVRKNIANS